MAHKRVPEYYLYECDSSICTVEARGDLDGPMPEGWGSVVIDIEETLQGVKRSKRDGR